MHSSLFSFYEEFGATARAKNEALAARAAFVSGVMEQSYRLWLTLLTTEVTEAMHAAQDLSVCKNPAEVADVQRAWFQASSARAITSLQGTVEIANFLIRNLQDTVTALPTSLVPSVGELAAPAPAVTAPLAPAQIAAPIPTPSLPPPATVLAEPAVAEAVVAESVVAEAVVAESVAVAPVAAGPVAVPASPDPVVAAPVTAAKAVKAGTRPKAVAGTAKPVKH